MVLLTCTNQTELLKVGQSGAELRQSAKKHVPCTGPIESRSEAKETHSTGSVRVGFQMYLTTDDKELWAETMLREAVAAFCKAGFQCS
jgi:hypothetical protein